MQFFEDNKTRQYKTDMKKILTFLAAAVSAAMVFSCEELPQTNLPTATLSADEAFVDGKANITVTLSSAAPVDVTATIAYGSAREGKTAIELSALKFDETVVLRAGEKVASCTVELVSTENIPNGAEAPIALAAVSADDYGQLKCDVAIAYITYNANTYNGDNGGNSEEPNNPGGGSITWTLQNDWSVVITGTELLSQTQGKYTYYYIEANLTAPGSTYIYTDSFVDDDEFAEYGGESLEEWAKEMEGYLAEALAKGSIDDYLYTAGSLYLDYYGAGDSFLYVLDFDANGKLTGKYAKIAVTFPEIEGYNPGGDDDDDDDDDDDEPVLVDRFAINGTGDALYTFGLMEKGAIDSSNLEENMLEIGQSIVNAYEYYAMLYEIVGQEINFTVADFLNDSEYNTADFYAVDNGQYDVLIVGMNEEGNLTGQYNVSTVTVDGHALEELVETKTRLDRAVAQKVGKKAIKSKTNALHIRKRLISLRGEDGDITGTGDEQEITVTIVGNLTQMSAWQAEYLGRYEYSQPDDPDDPDYPEEEEYPFEGTLQLQSNWSVTVVGEPYYEGYYPIIDIQVNVPGIQFYWLEENTAEDIEDYYDGDIVNIASAWQTEYVNDVKGGDAMEDLAWYQGDPATYLDVYNPGATTTVYLFEFDKDGWATGRYSATEVTIPELKDEEGGFDAPRQRKVRFRIKK